MQHGSELMRQRISSVRNNTGAWVHYRVLFLSTQYLVDDESRGWHGAGSIVREYQVKINVQ